MGEVTIFEQLDGVNDVLASIAEDFDADLYTGKQAQRIVCAAADIERFAVTLKTLAMRRVDQTDAWKRDGARSPQAWLANTTGTTMSDAYGTVELGEQLEHLPTVAAAARKGQLSPGKTKMIAGAASKDPDSEAHARRNGPHRFDHGAEERVRRSPSAWGGAGRDGQDP